MKRGEVYYITSNWQEVGSEQRAGRLAVIVSNDNNNNSSEVVEVVYMTTSPKHNLPTHVFTQSTARDSTILCEQICSVSKERIGEYVCTLPEKDMQAVDNALLISLGLDVKQQEGMREPTEEELEKIRELIRRERPLVIDTPETDSGEWEALGAVASEIIKTKAERDLYKKFSEDLLEILKGGAKS